MNNKQKFLDIVLSHATIILGVIFLLFIILDNINTAMNFLSSTQSKLLLFMFCAFAVTGALRLIIRIHKSSVNEWKERDNEELQKLTLQNGDNEKEESIWADFLKHK